MISESQWKRWKDNSTTDDHLNTYVLSDIRQMLGEIERQHVALKGIFMLALVSQDILPGSDQMQEAGRIIAEIDAFTAGTKP